MTNWSVGRIACVAIAAILFVVIVTGCVLCRYHGRRARRARADRDLKNRCASLVRMERGDAESAAGDSCEGCSDKECLARTRQFGSTLAVPALAYDPDREKVAQPAETIRSGVSTVAPSLVTKASDMTLNEKAGSLMTKASDATLFSTAAAAAVTTKGSDGSLSEKAALSTEGSEETLDEKPKSDDKPKGPE